MLCREHPSINKPHTPDASRTRIVYYYPLRRRNSRCTYVIMVRQKCCATTIYYSSIVCIMMRWKCDEFLDFFFSTKLRIRDPHWFVLCYITHGRVNYNLPIKMAWLFATAHRCLYRQRCWWQLRHLASSTRCLFAYTARQANTHSDKCRHNSIDGNYIGEKWRVARWFASERNVICVRFYFQTNLLNMCKYII